MAFKMKGFPQHMGVNSSPMTKKGGGTTATHTINEKKHKTTLHKDRPNERGESQKEVLDKAYNKVKEQTKKINKHYEDPRYNKDLSQEEYDDLTKAEEKATFDYNKVADRFSHVSDSINTVNRKFPGAPKRRDSDLFGPKKTPWYPFKHTIKTVKKIFSPKKKTKNLSKKRRTPMSEK